MKKLLLLQGPISSRSGYGDHSRDLLKSLIKMDKYDIKVSDLRWGDCPRNAISKEDEYLKDYFMIDNKLDKQPDIFVQISVPNEFNPVGKYNIGITAGIETNACSASWIEGLNRMNLILVPSTHSKNVLQQTVFDKVNEKTKEKEQALQCNTPIEVLLEGLDLEQYNKNPIKSEHLSKTMSKIQEDFCFPYVGHWLQGDFGHDRKDTGAMIRTFCETFKKTSKKRPALILKTSQATFSVVDREATIQRIESITSNYTNPPNIYLIHGDLSVEEMNQLNNHHKVKAMLSFTKGEGYGRPLLEFSVTGKPVIAPNWSGHIDFLKHAVMLPGELKTVHKSVQWKDVIIPESKWFYVNYPYASKVLKDIYKNYKKYLETTRKQAKYSRDNFSLDIMDKQFIKILDEYCPEQIKIVLPELNKKINLPKLKKMEL